MIRLVIVLLLIVFAIGFGIRNSDQLVTLHYYFGFSTPPLPVYQIVLGTFVISGLIVIVLLLPDWIRLRLLLRKQRKALRLTEKALKRVQPTQQDEDSAVS